MIMSSNITQGDAIKAASNRKAELKWSNDKQTSRMYSEQTDDQLLCSVADIIWRDIDKVSFLGHFPSSTEVSFENSLKSMPDSLVKLLIWITDEKAFSTCTLPSNIKTESVRKKTLNCKDTLPVLQTMKSVVSVAIDTSQEGTIVFLSKKGADVTVVAYPPIIDSKPNDMATVYTAMKKCLDMSNDAGQDYAIQTFDQQLYAIAQQVKWSKPDIFNRHILRLGGFHSLSCFLASIGKLWAELMLNGKEFNRAVRGFTLVFEALQVLFISAFIHWCRTFDYFDQIPSAFWNVLLEFHTSDPRCPVSLYLMYAGKRPEKMKADDSKFYVGINNKGYGDEWFINQPMGKNTLSNIIKSMTDEAGIQGRKVNHSARKTGITTLIHAGVQNTLVQQHSGHKSLSSINNYSSASFQQQKDMSKVLCTFTSNQDSTTDINQNTIQPGDSTANLNNVDTIPDDEDDMALVRASQEMIENTLLDIENFENYEVLDIHNDIHVDNCKKSSNLVQKTTDMSVRMSENYSVPSILQGATVKGNVIINYGNPIEEKENYQRQTQKKRKWVIYDSSDSD
ncbi:unnamed protein product [Mytilus edulis]|uniref:Tyr recombinase domain-containing protein n=1 Tax=Mytilus edulis TaxID=6550 RepID=A0A8S3TTB8_MYTED|nr:unnamed protein product [Mytilus edulis]